MLLIAGVVAAVVCMFVVWRVARKRVSEQTIAAFETALRDADSLRIVRPHENQILFETNDVNVIRELSENIKLNRFGAERYCECSGDVKFEFYSGGQLTTAFTFHHKYKIRWRDFHKDIKLTNKSAAFLVNWLMQNVKDEKFLEDFSIVTDRD